MDFHHCSLDGFGWDLWPQHTTQGVVAVDENGGAMRPARATRSGPAATSPGRSGCRRRCPPVPSIPCSVAGTLNQPNTSTATIRGRDQVTTDDQAQRHEIQQPVDPAQLRFSPGTGGEDGGCAWSSATPSAPAGSGRTARRSRGADPAPGYTRGRNSPDRSSTGPAAAGRDHARRRPVQDDLDQTVAIHIVMPHRISPPGWRCVPQHQAERDECAQQHQQQRDERVPTDLLIYETGEIRTKSPGVVRRYIQTADQTLAFRLQVVEEGRHAVQRTSRRRRPASTDRRTRCRAGQRPQCPAGTPRLPATRGACRRTAAPGAARPARSPPDQIGYTRAIAL